MVFLEIEKKGKVIVPHNELKRLNISLRKYLTIQLLPKIGRRKASKEHGYFVSPTILNYADDGQINKRTHDVLFKVSFNCITMKPCKGEILIGVVDKILINGIFLKSGPMENIFLSEKKMKTYKYNMANEEAVFVNMNRGSSMQKGTNVRFKVFAVKWIESEKEFHILATIEAHYLGPIRGHMSDC